MAHLLMYGLLVSYFMLCSEESFRLRVNQIKSCTNKINSGEFEIPDHVSYAARCLLEKMIEVDPEKRITASEILKDPWLTSKESFFNNVFYRFNGSDGITTALNSKLESRKASKMEKSPYKDHEGGAKLEQPYEAYFPND